MRRPLIALAAWTVASHLLAAMVTSASAQPMTLPGTFKVSESGAAVYDIPIAVPPGTAGMTPSLSLTYNSQGGDGVVGVGWSLAGTLSIGRCPQTFAQDGVRGAVNFDANDRFCLEGQRLVAISGAYGADGTEYRTEVDSYSRIISRGTAGTGPAWFEVRTKSGQIMEFGHTADSQILALGKTSARSWALNKVSDTKGNYYTVAYTNDTINGQAYPSEINYTGNAAAGLAPYNKVQFVYATRPDITPIYQAGSLLRTTVRLTNIKTYAGTTLVSDYRLTYQQSSSTQRSELTSISLCAADGACLPATAITWSAGTGGGFGQTSNTISNWSFGSPPHSTFLPVIGDFNGDGKTDYMLTANSTQYVFLSSGGGGFTTKQNTIANWNFGAPPQSYYLSVVGDFNGDGKTDYMLTANSTQYVFLSNGDGAFTQRQNTIAGWNFGVSPESSYLSVIGDFNGDGKTDYMLTAGSTQYVFLSNGDGTFAQRQNTISDWSFGMPPSSSFLDVVGDFNGDGKTDYMLTANSTQYVFLSNGDGTFSQRQNTIAMGWNFGSPPQSSFLPVIGDFNADGKTDYVLTANATQYVFLSKGDGTFAQSQNAIADWNFGSSPTSAFLPLGGDFNGDGKADYMLTASSIQYVFLSKGDGTFTQRQNTIASWNFGSPPQATFLPVGGDYNGDGLADYMLTANSTQYVSLGNGPTSDVAQSITNGVGATTSITYQPLTNASVYTKDTTAAYPVQDMQEAVYVVSRVDKSNGVGGTYSSSYRYAGAKVDMSGRGLLGFRQMSVTDLQTNIVTTTNYRQDFPYIGVVASESTVLGAQTLNQSTKTYQFSNASGAASVSTPSGTSAPYRVRLSDSVTSSADLDGTAMPTVTSSYQDDAYGNATQVTVAASDGYSKTTTNTYTNDTTNWLLGRLTASTVTSQAPQQLGQYCSLPWGGTIGNGQSVTAYSAASPPAGEACSTIAQTRTCTNGTLSGSYTQQTCAAACTLPWGGTISEGQSVTAYSASTVPSGQVCSSVAQTRTCTNGTLSGSYTYQSCVSLTPVRIYLTSGTSWTVPSDWNNSNNSIEVIGGGGGGASGNGAQGGGGGGGGAYSKISNLTLTLGASVPIQVGTGGGAGSAGGDTWFNGASLAASSVGAKGGSGGSLSSAGSGGSAASGTGATKNSGGNGGAPSGGGAGGAGGGGGAAGPGGAGWNAGSAAGFNSGSGGGGGGGGSGSAGAAPGIIPSGGLGGNGPAGTGGGASDGAAGTAGTGGGGAGSGGSSTNGGGAGGSGSTWDSAHGAGGGAGGGANRVSNQNAVGGAGGLYGGGGGGGGGGTFIGTGGTGGQGLIVINYTPGG